MYLEKYGKVRKNPGCSWDIARYCDIHAKSIEDIEGDLGWRWMDPLDWSGSYQMLLNCQSLQL
jgi:hypothetical protein